MVFLVVLADSDLPRYKRAQQVRRCLADICVPKDLIVITQSEWDREVKAPASLASACQREGRVVYEAQEWHPNHKSSA